MIWRFRHWLASRVLKVALAIFPESPAKDNLYRALNAWGRDTLNQLAALTPAKVDEASAKAIRAMNKDYADAKDEFVKVRWEDDKPVDEAG